MSLFQDARRIEGELGSKFVFSQWMAEKNPRFDKTDVAPRSSLIAPIIFPYAPPRWFEKERQLQIDSIKATSGQFSGRDSRVGKLVADHGYEVDDAIALTVPETAIVRMSHHEGHPVRKGFGYIDSRPGRYPSEAVAGGMGGVDYPTFDMLQDDMGSMGTPGPLVRGGFQSYPGPVRMSHAQVGSSDCSRFCQGNTGKACSNCTSMAPRAHAAMATVPALQIRPDQNPAAFDLDRHSYQSWKRGLPVPSKMADPYPPRGAWDSQGYLVGVKSQVRGDGRLSGGIASPMRVSIAAEDVHKSPTSTMPWSKPRGSEPWVSDWAGGQGKDVYYPKGLSDSAPREYVSFQENGDEPHCTFAPEMFLGYNELSEQF